MNREIKFRVWDTFNLRMVYDPYYFRKRDEPDLEDERFNSPMQYAEHWQDVDDGIWRPCILMQYTGLKDKNGKEIYEGDVVDVAYAQRDDEGYIVSDPPARGFVDWNEHSTGWIVRAQSKMSVTPDGTVMTSIITKEPGYIEIVGNKFQNPELL